MRTEEEGSGREAARCASEAFRCEGANLLPDTKFIGNGLFIKYLGQVDLPDAPLEHRSHTWLPPGRSLPLPGFLKPAQFSMWERKKQLCGTGDIICNTLGVTNSDIFSNKIR